MFLPFIKHNPQTGTRRFTLQFNQCRCCPDHFRPRLKVVGWVWNDFIDRVHRGPSFCRPKFVRSPWYQQLNFVAATAGSNSATVVAPKESDSTHGQNMVDVRKINHQGNRVHLKRGPPVRCKQKHVSQPNATTNTIQGSTCVPCLWVAVNHIYWFFVFAFVPP